MKKIIPLDDGYNSGSADETYRINIRYAPGHTTSICLEFFGNAESGDQRHITTESALNIAEALIAVAREAQDMERRR